MFLNVLVNLLLLWITYVNGFQCNEGCENCDSDNVCFRCEAGYFLKYTIIPNTAKCFKCPSKCKSCLRYDDCQLCKPTFYGRKCERSCSLCKNRTCNSNGCLNGCKMGYYLRNRTRICAACPYRCTECTTKYVCSTCKPGWWGDGCRYSCNPCSKCVSKSCKNKCIEYSYYQCANSRCPDKCSIDFSGAQGNTTATSTTQPSMTHLATPLTTRSTPTTRRTQLTVKPLKSKPSALATSTTDGQDTLTLYIIIAGIGIMVLAVAIMVVICIKKRKQTSCRDHVSSSPDTQAESHQIADNAGVYSYVSNNGNAFGNIANINIAESDTGYDDINTIDNVATINVAESDTGYVDLNATVYENVVDKTARNALDTGHAYEAFNQYTNVRGAENKNTSLTDNENFYYNVLTRKTDKQIK